MRKKFKNETIKESMPRYSAYGVCNRERTADAAFDDLTCQTLKVVHTADIGSLEVQEDTSTDTLVVRTRASLGEGDAQRLTADLVDDGARVELTDGNGARVLLDSSDAEAGAQAVVTADGVTFSAPDHCTVTATSTSGIALTAPLEDDAVFWVATDGTLNVGPQYSFTKIDPDGTMLNYSGLSWSQTAGPSMTTWYNDGGSPPSKRAGPFYDAKTNTMGTVLGGGIFGYVSTNNITITPPPCSAGAASCTTLPDPVTGPKLIFPENTYPAPPTEWNPSKWSPATVNLRGMFPTVESWLTAPDAYTGLSVVVVQAESTSDDDFGPMKLNLGYRDDISVAKLKSLVNESADFAAFKLKVDAL